MSGRSSLIRARLNYGLLRILLFVDGNGRRCKRVSLQLGSDATHRTIKLDTKRTMNKYGRRWDVSNKVKLQTSRRVKHGVRQPLRARPRHAGSQAPGCTGARLHRRPTELKGLAGPTTKFESVSVSEIQ